MREISRRDIYRLGISCFFLHLLCVMVLGAFAIGWLFNSISYCTRDLNNELYCIPSLSRLYPAFVRG